MSANRHGDERPLVSVIVPAYNAGRFLAATLHSLVAQTYPCLEIVVVDDGSTDDTADIGRRWAEAHPQIRLIQQANAGVAAARNRAFEESRGVFIAPVDADDVWFPTAVEKLVACLGAAPPTVGVAYAWSVTIDDAGMPDGRFRCATIAGDVAVTLVCHNFLGNASVTMLRRTALEQVGAYDRGFATRDAQGCEDWDLYLRLAERCEFRVVPEFLVGYRRPVASMSSDPTSMSRSHAHLLEKIRARRPGVSSLVQRVSTGSFLLYLAYELSRRGLWRHSSQWMGRALVRGCGTPVLHPGFFPLLARNALAMVSVPRRQPGPPSQRSAGDGATPDQVADRVIAIGRRRLGIRARLVAQSVLHCLASRLRSF